MAGLAGRAGRLCALSVAAFTLILPTSGMAAADGGPVVVGEPRPELIDSRLRPAVDAAGQGEEVEYLVALDARPDLEAIRFDRESVVAALRETAAVSQRPVVEYLDSQGAQVLNTFWLANLVLARSSVESLTALTGVRGVEAVLPVVEIEIVDPAIEPLEVGSATLADGAQSSTTWGLDRIGAHRVWDELGLDGSGVRVAVLDSGVDISHADLAGKLVSDDPADPAYPGGWMEWDAAGNPVQGQPRDTHWHGTHVSGTIHGGRNFADGTAIGVAPGAEMMHGLVLPDGSGPIPRVVAGMQWAIDPYDMHGNPAGRPAQVVNMSFGPQAGGIVDELAEPIRNMYFAGVVPVAAVGNCGNGCHGSPANVYETLAVGATDINDDVAAFSGGGVVSADDWADRPAGWPESWLAPDLSAPGVDVVSSIPPGTLPDDPDAIYGRADGTSMASPHAAGVVTLMLSSNPDLPIDAITDRLTGTSFFDDRHGEQRPNSRYGHGRIDAFNAVSQVALDSGVSGTVADADSGDPVAGVRVDVVEAGISTATDSQGRYELRLLPGSYTVAFSWAGRVVLTIPDVVVTEAALTRVDAALSGVRGRVVDASSNRPIADVAVRAVGVGVAGRTDARGRFRLYLAPGDYQLAFSRFGYDDAVRSGVEVVADRLTQVKVPLALLPVGTVSGTVAFADSGVGVPGVSVVLDGTPLSTTTAGDGTYTITGVPVGSYPVHARSGLLPNPPMQTTTVEPDAAAVADFALTCGLECLVQEDWAARYDGPASGFEFVSAMDLSRDGSAVYVTGQSPGDGAGDDFATIAYDAATGDQLWVARYDGPASDDDIAHADSKALNSTRSR